jgi:hypothetical protein
LGGIVLRKSPVQRVSSGKDDDDTVDNNIHMLSSPAMGVDPKDLDTGTFSSETKQKKTESIKQSKDSGQNIKYVSMKQSKPEKHQKQKQNRKIFKFGRSSTEAITTVSKYLTNNLTDHTASIMENNLKTTSIIHQRDPQEDEKIHIASASIERVVTEEADKIKPRRTTLFHCTIKDIQTSPVTTPLQMSLKSMETSTSDLSKTSSTEDTQSQTRVNSNPRTVLFILLAARRPKISPTRILAVPSAFLRRKMQSCESCPPP